MFFLLSEWVTTSGLYGVESKLSTLLSVRGDYDVSSEGGKQKTNNEQWTGLTARRVQNRCSGLLGGLSSIHGENQLQNSIEE